MSRGLFLLLRMLYCSRLLLYMTVYQESDAKKDERYAQPLAHVQGHVILEHDLRLLDEFYEESHSETSYKESADEEASVKLWQAVLVHQYLEDSQKEIAQCLIKLGRVFRFSLPS